MALGKYLADFQPCFFGGTAVVTCPDFRESPLAGLQFLNCNTVCVPILFDAGWSVAQVLFGISIQRLGLALAYALVVGLGTLLGTLIPLFARHRAQVDKKLLIEVLAGIVSCVDRNRAFRMG